MYFTLEVCIPFVAIEHLTCKINYMDPLSMNFMNLNLTKQYFWNFLFLKFPPTDHIRSKLTLVIGPLNVKLYFVMYFVISTIFPNEHKIYTFPGTPWGPYFTPLLS